MNITSLVREAHVSNVSKQARYLADVTETRKKCIKNAEGAVVAPRCVARIAYLINNRLNNKSPCARAAVFYPRCYANGVLILRILKIFVVIGQTCI